MAEHFRRIGRNPDNRNRKEKRSVQKNNPNPSIDSDFVKRTLPSGTIVYEVKQAR